MRDVEGLVDVHLIVKVMQQLLRGAREFASVGEGQVGGNQEVGQVFGGNLAGDGLVVAGGAGVFDNGLVVWGEPQKSEDGAVKVSVGGAEVVERGVRLSESGKAGKVKCRGRCVADGDEGAGGESQRGKQIVMRWWWGGGSAERAHVDNRAFKKPV